MKLYKKPPKKPLFDEKQGEIFIACIDNDIHKKIAKMIFVEGMTNEEVAEEMNYCKRQIERIRIDLMKIVLKRLIEKQIPKKGSIKYLSSYTDDPPVLLCPNCQEHIPTEGCNFYKYCYKCGQAIDWSDTE